MPPGLTEDGRRAFVEIAVRAQAERSHAYTMLCLGLQSFLTAERLRAAVASDLVQDHPPSA